MLKIYVFGLFFNFLKLFFTALKNVKGFLCFFLFFFWKRRVFKVFYYFWKVFYIYDCLPIYLA